MFGDRTQKTNNLWVSFKASLFFAKPEKPARKSTSNIVEVEMIIWSWKMNMKHKLKFLLSILKFRIKRLDNYGASDIKTAGT